MRSQLAAVGLTATLVAVEALAVQTGFLVLVLATVLVAQCLIASAPSPADQRGRSVATPQFWPTIISGVAASVIAFEPRVLIGAPGTRAGADGAVSTGVFAGVIPAVAFGLILAIIVQLARRDGRSNLVLSLSVVVTLTVFSALASAWIGAVSASGSRSGTLTIGGDLVTCACAAVGVGLLGWVVPWSRPVGAAVSMGVGAAASAGTAWLIGGELVWPFAAAVGMGATGFALIGLLIGAAWTRGRGHVATTWGFPGALAFVLTGPLVYIAAQMATASL